MRYIKRNKSVITDKTNLEPLYNYNNFPVFIGCTDQSMDKDLFADLSLAICKDTGIIQLDKVLPPDVVYSGYHSEALGGVWERHHVEFLEFINKYKLQKILEVGGGNGRMAIDYVKDNPRANWIIVEPNPVELHSLQIKYIPELFDENFTFAEKIDGIVHSHAFEHMYFPRPFLRRISEMLTAGQHHLFTLPNLYAYLENKFTNCLNFEHTIFLTEYFVDYLLSEYNFEIEEKKYFQNHSIFYATKKVEKAKPFKFESQYEKYKTMFSDYLNYNKEVIHQYNAKIEEFDGSVYLFGAHVFSQHLLNQGLRKNKVKGILDNSKIKQQKRLYGTDLFVQAPESIKEEENVAVILKAGAYQDEIKTQLNTINPAVIIWE